MAGRGRRLGGYGEKGVGLRRPGEIGIFSQCETDINIQSLIKSINELSLTSFDPIALHETEIMFRKLCTTGDMVRDVLMNLHCKALSDSLFGEKLLLILEQVASLEVDNVCVRSELLNFIENDFKMKDTLFQSDSQKFLNAVSFHGRVYNVIKIQGVPIKVLGAALLEYMDLLMNGSEKQLRVLVIQILLNGHSISKTDSLVQKYESLKCNLRKTLIEKNLNRDSMFYVLLALDYLSSNLQPLTGVVRDFYVENMGEDFLALEYLIKDSHLSPSSEIQLTNKVTRNKNIFNVNETSYESKEILKNVEDLNISQDVGKSFSHSHNQDVGKNFSHSHDQDVGKKSFSHSHDQDVGKKSFSHSHDQDVGKSFSHSHDQDVGKKSFSHSHDQDVGKSFSHSHDQDVGKKSFSHSHDQDVGKSFSRSHNQDVGKNLSRSHNQDVGKSFSRSHNQDVGKNLSRSRDIMTSDSFTNESGMFGYRNRKFDDKKQINNKNDFKKSTDLVENKVGENEEFYGIQLKSNRIGARKLMTRISKEKDHSENKAKFQSEVKVQSEDALSTDKIKTSEPVWE